MSLLTKPPTKPLTRTLSTSTTTTPTHPTPILVPATPLAELEPLLTSHGGKWTLSADGKALERRVVFGTFRRMRVYNKTFLRLTTHRDKASGQSGISALDLDLARFCDGAIGEDDISADGAQGMDGGWGAGLMARVLEGVGVSEGEEGGEGRDVGGKRGGGGV
ncbi:hypothetical protein MMC34_000895 [Xylographa carneopallida]|nr:hypothetical protein [Xylographa carneopallida]